MSWHEGTIEEFKGGNPKHRELRKIRTQTGQDFKDMHFFHLSLGRAAGYTDAELAAGRQIEFEPDPLADRPKVLRLKPRERQEVARATVAATTRTFLNPYHFVPLLAPPETSLAEAEEVLRGTLHDRFGGRPEGAARYSGRIVCRLETEGPVVVGAEQPRVEGDGEKEREIHPFGFADPQAPDKPYRRTPMIPGSTLRGLVSSLVEAASGSTMRVLHDRTFTRRADLGFESLSEVGLLVEDGGVLKLRPLTLSLDEMTARGKGAPRERCRVLLNAYRKGTPKEYDRGSFLDRERPTSWSSSHQEYWYLDLQKADWHYSRRGQPRNLGLMAEEEPIRETVWSALAPQEKARFTRGLLFVLGIEEDEKVRNLPSVKTHEYFIPCMDEPTAELLEIREEALEDFKRLAKDSAEIPRGGAGGGYPFLPAGRERAREGVTARANDLVYFDKDAEGRVSRISFSSAWRRLVQGNLYGALERVSPHLVPLHAGREKLTLAEQLFGFVEDRGKRALAGRLRFAHALVESKRPADGWYGPPVTLKILAAPKPPSPALYFGNKRYFAKRELNLHEHEPHGRKVYLHHRQEDIERGSYRSAEPNDKRKLKARVRPLGAGARFLFHVDFENLTREELGYLLYALRPTEDFRHKLGMGKPLGLGRVRIDPLALAWRDRLGGYGPEALFARKYRWIESPAGAEEWRSLPAPLADRYRHESEAAGAGDAALPADRLRMADLRERVRDQIPQTVRYALELLGNPASVKDHPVTYPVLQNPPREGEHFQWFVQNDKNERKALAAIPLGGSLPTLERYTPPPPRRR